MFLEKLVSLVCPISLSLTIFVSPLLYSSMKPKGGDLMQYSKVSHSLHIFPTVGFYINSLLLQDETAVMIAEQDTDMKITDYHYESLLFSRRYLTHLILGSLSSKQCWGWIPSHGVRLKYDQISVGYSKLCATFALVCLTGR